jgi:hypothetical protein
MGRQLFGQQVADFKKELANGAPARATAGPAKEAYAPAAFPAPAKVDEAKVNAVVERTNTASKYYNVLILLNGVPISAPQMKQLNPQKIQSMKVLNTKEEMRAYTEANLNAIILLLAAE